MEEMGAGNTCPHCGYGEGASPESLLHLPPGTVLQNKYLLGRVLGQGGFGITYLAWDTTLNIKLAIKEYLPQQLATRSAGQNTVTVYKSSLAPEFRYGLNKFLEEARTLARFNEHPNIVTVRDYFEANNTAYLVMNHHQGVTLQSYLDSKGGKISVEQALEIFMPVLDALKEVHAAGILHRDISPDNLLINTEGRVILIDFGAARQAIGDQSRSLSVIMKAGYSPPEQYQSQRRQGPWTDIYAVAASFYRSITGQAPLEAIDRMAEDNLIQPSQLGIVIEPKHERALMKALAIKTAERYTKVEDFQSALLRKSSQAEKMQSEPAADSSSTYKEKHFKPESIRGEDIFKEILLSRQEADFGAKRSIIVDLETICLDCGGMGIKNGSKCSKCEGNGKEQKKISVKIPAGVKEGTRIRLQGQGTKGINGGANGDLFLKVKLKEYKEERSSYNHLNSQFARGNIYDRGKGKTPRRKNRSFNQIFHQYMYYHLGSKNQLLNYIIVAAMGAFLLISIFGHYGLGDVILGIAGSGEKESGQEISPATISGLDADYYINYENGSIPIGDLPIGARVVDPTWEWEYRTGENYTGRGIVKPVVWILVAKNHYAGLEPHVTLLAEELIGLYTFDDSTNRDHEYAEYGYNHWGDSGTMDARYGLRPWLNSSGIHADGGFYLLFSENLKQAVLTTTVPNKEWRNDEIYFTEDNVFIPSSTELGGHEHGYNIYLGSIYHYFSVTGEENRKATMLGDNWHDYWTRSPESVYGAVIYVDTNGWFENVSARYGGQGVRPVVNLRSAILVSGVEQ